MAQLLAPVPDAGRISQFLPTVKCSSCNEPVSIHDLTDHVCQSSSPVSPGGKSLVSPLSAIELDPQRVQSGQVLFPASKTVLAKQPVSSHQVSAPDSRTSVAGSVQHGRPRAPSSATVHHRRGGDAPRRLDQSVPQPYRNGAPDARRPSISGRPGPGPAGPLTIRSPPAGRDAIPPSLVPFSSARSPPMPSHLPSPGRNYPPLPNSPAMRPQVLPPALSAGPRPSPLSPNATRQLTQSNPAPHAPVAGGSSIQPLRPRASTNVIGPQSNDGSYELVYHTDNRCEPKTAPLPVPSPFAASNAPLMPPSRPRVDSTASLPPIQPLRVRAPSTASLGAYSHQQHPGAQAAQGAGGRAPFERRPSNLGAGASSVASPLPLQAPLPSIDTKIGGEAGMAGVGRRGFATAAVHAPFVPPNSSQAPLGHDDNDYPTMVPGQSMGGRRANAPSFLDIASASRYTPAAPAHSTPPLSPANSGTSPLSPRSPYSQKSPASAGIPSPLSRAHPHPQTPTSPEYTPGAGGPAMHRDRVVPSALEPPKTPLPAIPATPTTPSAASIRLPFFEKFKAKQPEALENKPDPDPGQKQAARPPSPSSDTESEYDGLAYARSDAGEGEFDDKPLKCPIPPLKIPDKQKDGHDAGTDGGKVRFPSMAGSESQYSPTSPSSPRLPMRSISAAAALRPALRSTGALDRVSEDTSEFLVPASAPPVPDSHRDSVNRPPKLPMRSHTSPTLSAGRQEHAGGKGKARVGRVCARCEKAIDDRRWIAMDGGSVLCDKCWKNIYLPKCRRCNLPIEKQAVSSSDGQLKGKYHRDCFNCDKCHKPFPDKSFYVLDGKPFCAYHYHEANKSLCTAATCGQPIEGPCAVSHTGHRYHPDHLLCEYTRCTERLVDYWEMDGRMLCEWHAQKVMGEAVDEVADSLEELLETSRDSIAVSHAMKRTTRFIDLGGSELR